MSFIPFLLQNASDGAPQPGGRGGLGMLIPLILIVVIMYFFMIRPQNKKQKETQKMLAALKKGDKVITIGGIHGVVTLTKENTVIVKVDDGAKIEFNRSAIASVIVDKPAAPEAKDEKKTSLFGRKKDKASVEEKKDSAQETVAEEKAAEEPAAKESKTSAEKKSTKKTTSDTKAKKAKAKTEAK